uniref:FlgO domain-containing protein n=1 Tax=candidate division WOR-3 bacterium TaxID=2052148 RepID=A0A7C4CCV2_UNCW3
MNRLLPTAVLLICIGAVSPAIGAKDEALTATTFIHEDAAGKLAIIGSVAVIVSGTEPFISSIMEDALAVSLMLKGIKVAYPDEKNLGKTRTRPADDPLRLAKSVGANCLITGTLVTEPPSLEQFRPLRIAIASLSLIDVPMDKTLVWALYEPEQPVTTTKIARAFTQTLLESLK